MQFILLLCVTMGPAIALGLFQMASAYKDQAASGAIGISFLRYIAPTVIMWILAIAIIWIGLERLVLRWVVYLRRLSKGYAKGHYMVNPSRDDDISSEFHDLGLILSQMASTARERQNNLHAALEQKNKLVREIHHRVRNNLQIIQSLLNLASRQAGNAEELALLASSKRRISALALAHQNIYEDDSLEYVNLNKLLNDICKHAMQDSRRRGSGANLTVDVPDIIVNADVAVPISLLVTEAVTNAGVRALQFRSPGHVAVRLVNDPVDGAELTIQDDSDLERNAAGLIESKGNDIGSVLIDGFARQLKGTVQPVARDTGTLSVRFPFLAVPPSPAPSRL